MSQPHHSLPETVSTGDNSQGNVLVFQIVSFVSLEGCVVVVEGDQVPQHYVVVEWRQWITSRLA